MIHSTTGTRDMQTVDLSLRILFRPVEEKLPEILNNLGQDYDEKVLPSIGNEVLKAVVAQYNAD
jgi:prohibitin 1